MHKGRKRAFRPLRAQIFLQVDEGPWGPGRTDTVTPQILTVVRTMVSRPRLAYIRKGLVAALQPLALDHSRRARSLDGAGAAGLTKLAGLPAPAGTSGSILHLLADQLVALQVVESIGRETVRVSLRKTGCSIGKSAAGA